MVDGGSVGIIFRIVQEKLRERVYLITLNFFKKRSDKKWEFRKN